jgi:hypothetical protein
LRARIGFIERLLQAGANRFAAQRMRTMCASPHRRDNLENGGTPAL